MRTKSRLSAADAIEKLGKMIDLIVPEVDRAVRIEASLETVNAIMGRGLHEVEFTGAHCLNVVQQSQALHLAMTVAKLHEVPNPRRNKSGTRRENRIARYDESDVASIPLMVRLLHHEPCRVELARRARNWTPPDPPAADLWERDCRRAMDAALKAYSDLLRPLEGRKALKHLSEFRNKALAHTLMDVTLRTLPKYRDLFRMVDAARRVTYHALVAIKGVDRSFDIFEQEVTAISKAFWEPALEATVEANRWDRLQPPMEEE